MTRAERLAEDDYIGEDSYTEHLRRKSGNFTIAQYSQPGNEIAQWLSSFPVKVREAIFLILDGYYHQARRAHRKGAQTASRARRKGVP